MFSHRKGISMACHSLHFPILLTRRATNAVRIVEEKVSRPHSCKKSFHRNVSGGGLRQLSPPITLGGWPADEKYNLKSWMYNANLQVKYVKSNVESKNLIGKCSTLNAKTWKCNPLNLNANLNIAYEKMNVQGKNLNVARGKLNDESVNSDVK